MYFSSLPSSVPVGTLDIWYMKQNISSNRQQISLFWKVSFQFKTQGEYILNWVWEHCGFHMAWELRQFHDTWRNVISTPAKFPSPKFTSVLCPTSMTGISASKLYRPLLPLCFQNCACSAETFYLTESSSGEGGRKIRKLWVWMFRNCPHSYSESKRF